MRVLILAIASAASLLAVPAEADTIDLSQFGYQTPTPGAVEPGESGTTANGLTFNFGSQLIALYREAPFPAGQIPVINGPFEPGQWLASNQNTVLPLDIFFDQPIQSLEDVSVIAWNPNQSAFIHVDLTSTLATYDSTGDLIGTATTQYGYDVTGYDMNGPTFVGGPAPQFDFTSNSANISEISISANLPPNNWELIVSFGGSGPEPYTWLLMTTGFLATGLMLRTGRAISV